MIGLVQPSTQRSLLARAVVCDQKTFFLVTHKEKIGGTKYGAANLQMLRAWYNATAPTRYKLSCNEAIREIHGNHSPLARPGRDRLQVEGGRSGPPNIPRFSASALT